VFEDIIKELEVECLPVDLFTLIWLARGGHAHSSSFWSVLYGFNNPCSDNESESDDDVASIQARLRPEPYIPFPTVTKPEQGLQNNFWKLLKGSKLSFC